MKQWIKETIEVINFNDFNGDLDSVIDVLLKLKEKVSQNGWKDVVLVVSEGYDYNFLDLSYYRLETPYEVTKREAREREREKALEKARVEEGDKERALLKELKEKYEWNT